MRIFALVLGGDARIYRQHAFQLFAYRQRHATFLKRLDHALRRNIPNQRILCERTSAETAQGAETTSVRETTNPSINPRLSILILKRVL